MNNFIHAIDEFYINDFHYEDTDSMYIKLDYWEKNDYKEKIIIKMELFGMVCFWLQKNNVWL